MQGPTNVFLKEYILRCSNKAQSDEKSGGALIRSLGNIMNVVPFIAMLGCWFCTNVVVL